MPDPARKAARQPAEDGIVLRTDLRPGDIGEIVRLHGDLYAREHGFDVTFEAYVAGPLGDFVLHPRRRSRIWIAEAAGGPGEAEPRILGCIAIVEASETEAQLRWFLVHPAARGRGLGKRLLKAAVEFCRQSGYGSIFLFTVSPLASAARLYAAEGFGLVHEKPARWWGVDLLEQFYRLELDSRP